jgi:hypothetical protein
MRREASKKARPFPWGLSIAALLATAPFLLLHAAGCREYVSILSGTFPAAGQSAELLAGLGLLYAAAYLAFVVLAPVLVLSVGIVILLNRLWP